MSVRDFYCTLFIRLRASETVVIKTVFITTEILQCFDAVGWAAGRASGL